MKIQNSITIAINGDSQTSQPLLTNNNHSYYNNNDDDDNDHYRINNVNYYDYYYYYYYYPSKSFVIRVFAIGVVLSVIAFVLVKYYGHFIMEKEVIPAINWLTNTFSRPALAAILCAAIALLPVLLLPTLPFKWVVGMTFGYGIGFLLIIAGLAVAVSLPYFIGYHIFYHKIRKWLDEHPREASIVRLAGGGDWFHQFRAIVLIRLAPFPYVVVNYTAVVTGVKYIPYLVGSLVGIVPEIFVAIYSGILIQRLAKAVEDETHISKIQMILDGAGLCISMAAAIIVGFYSKGKLQQLQDEEQPQQQTPL